MRYENPLQQEDRRKIEANDKIMTCETLPDELRLVWRAVSIMDHCIYIDSATREQAKQVMRQIITAMYHLGSSQKTENKARQGLACASRKQWVSEKPC